MCSITHLFTIQGLHNIVKGTRGKMVVAMCRITSLFTIQGLHNVEHGTHGK